MFTEIYIEVLLVDEDLADQVWELWDASGSLTKSIDHASHAQSGVGGGTPA